MGKKRNIHTGSNFTNFLEAEGLEADVAARAIKRTFVRQLGRRMVFTNTTKAKLRKIFGQKTTQVFDEECTSLSLDTISKAATAVGCELQILLVPKGKLK